MKQHFVILWGPGPAWLAGKTVREQPYWAEHADFMDRLFENGTVLLGGPFSDASGSQVVVQAETEQEVAELAARDPFVEHGIFVLRLLKQWQLFLDARTKQPETPTEPRQGGHMDTLWNNALWLQFGAAIDMLENALLACPASLWQERLWSPPSDHSLPSEFSEFWYLTYHTLFWLDLYLSGAPEEEFTPPAPFSWTEQDPAVSPQRPYTKEELHSYLAATRRKCHTTLIQLSDERAREVVSYSWAHGQAVNFLELQLYNLRHVQEHAAQLSLFLGQHAISDEALDWGARAKGEPAY